MRRPGLAVAAIALVIVVAVVFVIRLPEPFGPDQGLFACFARFVPRGALPYRDLYDTKPPLFLYLFSIVSLIPGELHRAMWIFEGVMLALVLWVAYAFASHRFGRVAGLASAALLFAGLWAPGFGGFWARVQAEEILALPMLGSAWFAYRSRERPNLAFFAGVLAGVCGLCKVPALVIAPVWMLTFAIESRRALLPRIGLLVAGMLVPWALAFLWFLAHGALGWFVSAVFVQQRAYARLIDPPWVGVARDLSRTLLAVAALPLAAATVSLVILARHRPREAAGLAVWCVATIAAVAVQRQLAGYHYLLAMPALAIAGGHGIAVMLRALRSRGRPRAVAAITLTLLGALLVRTGASFWSTYSLGIAPLTGRMGRIVYLREVQQNAFAPVVEETIAEHIAARTQPSDRVLAWGLSPGIFALADRRSATRYVFHKLMLTDAALSLAVPGLEERRREVVASLLAEPPAYVVVGSGDTNWAELIDSRTSLAQLPGIPELLARRYVLERRVGRFAVYHRTQ